MTKDLIDLLTCKLGEGQLPLSPIFSLYSKPLIIHLIGSSLKELKNAIRKQWFFFLSQKHSTLNALYQVQYNVGVKLN